MIWINGKEISMRRGWVVQYSDGTLVTEDEMPWKKLPNKRNIVGVFLKWEDRYWGLEGKDNYTVPTKRGYIDISPTGVVGNEGLDSRTIGYYDMEGNCKVIMRVAEATGQMTYETIPF